MSCFAVIFKMINDAGAKIITLSGMKTYSGKLQ
jgi:hypothetical protein